MKSTRNIILISSAIAAVIVAAVVTSADAPGFQGLPTPTAEELAERRQRDFNELPEHDKLRISNDVGVHYLHCDPSAVYDPIATVLITHIPSRSWYSPLPLGGRSQTNYLTDEAALAIEEVIADEELMNRIMERSPKPVRCPPELATKAASFMDFIHDYDQMDIAEDIRVVFDECASNGEYGDVMQIFHLPTLSHVEVDRTPVSRPPGHILDIRYVASPSAKARLQEVLDDEELMEEIRAAGDKSVRCPENPTWYKEHDDRA